jgi:hypothetical protein
MEIGHLVFVLADTDSEPPDNHNHSQQRFWLGKVMNLKQNDSNTYVRDASKRCEDTIVITVLWYESSNEFGKYQPMTLREKNYSQDVSLSTCLYWMQMPTDFQVLI